MSKPKGKIVINADRCKGCGLCIDACPKKNIHLSEEPDLRGIRVACHDDSEECNACKFCYEVCPDVAITVYKSQKEFIDERRKRKRGSDSTNLER